MKNRGGYWRDEAYEVLLILLRAGLWERQPEATACFPLTDDVWERVFLLARQQTVAGLVFRGVQLLPKELLPPEKLQMRWIVMVDALERKNREMNKVLVDLCAYLAEAGVYPVVQKGQGVAQLYEKPLLRECGDIDLFFPSSKAAAAALQCIRICGIKPEKRADGSYWYKWKDVVVEHHVRLLDLHNPFQQHVAQDLINRYGFCHTALDTVPGHSITVPSPFLNLLLQNLHVMKHALGWGIGLRQLCDMARTCYVFRGKIDEAELRTVCRKLGVEKWTALLHAFLTEFLGLPDECLPYPIKAETAQPLLEIICRGGNFGQFVPERTDGTVSLRGNKWHTARAFWKNVCFSRKYAPKEAFWMVANLVKGRLL